MGLFNPNATNCNGGTCSGSLLWQDGAALAFNASWTFDMRVTVYAQYRCMYLRSTDFTLADIDCQLVPKWYSCQFDCAAAGECHK